MPHGFSNADWNAAKAEAKDALSKRAKLRGMMPYSELTKQITSIAFDHDDPRFNRWFLRDISVDEHKASRGMMTALVVYKEGSMEPGPGFFELASELGLNTKDIDKCWITELHNVHRAWQ